MPIDIGINAASINGALVIAFQPLAILAPPLPTPRILGLFRVRPIPTPLLSHPFLYQEGVLSVDYEVNVDPVFLKPPRRGHYR